MIINSGIFLCSGATLLGLTGTLKQDHTALVRSVMKQVMEVNKKKEEKCMHAGIHMYI